MQSKDEKDAKNGAKPKLQHKLQTAPQKPLSLKVEEIFLFISLACV